MKKVFTIFIITALIINSIGYYLISEAGIYQLKCESVLNIAKGLKSDLSVTFKLPLGKPGKDFEVNKNELTFKGRLYDIAKKEILGDTLMVICIPDGLENQLIEKTNDWTADQAGHSSNNKLLSIYKSIQLFIVENDPTKPSMASQVVMHKGFFLQELPCLSHNIIVPPPERV